MDSLFFYGSLRHRPLLEVVLGDVRDFEFAPATLPGHAVHWVRDQAFAQIVEEDGAVAQGVHVGGLDEASMARLDFYNGAFEFSPRAVSVDTDAGRRGALVYLPEHGRWPLGELWSQDAWKRDWAAISLRAAAEAMDQFGKISVAELARWLPEIRLRAASWKRAQTTFSPMNVRHGFDEADVIIEAKTRPYCKFFALEEQRLRFRRFDGSMSAPVDRAGFVTGDAVTVLPYDPVRDRVLLIEQFRFGPWVRGDRHPWSLEPIAGRIDPGETPEACALREAMEEASLTLQRLEPLARYYPTTGALAEYIISYIGIADLPDDITGIGGEVAEAEDIRSLVLSFEGLEALLASGEAENGPLILTALWLAANRSRLRGGA